MKKKHLILGSIFIMVIMPLHAQLSFGVRGGFNTSTVKLSDNNVSGYELNYDKGNFGYHFGVMGQLKVLGVFIQPELLFTTTKSSLAVKHLGKTTYGDQNFYKLDLPVIVGVKLGPLKLQAGPVASAPLGTKSQVLDDIGLSQKLKGATVGFQAGAGLQLSSLLLDIKYEGNLSKLGDGMTINSQQVNFDQRVSQVIFSIGYLF